MLRWPDAPAGTGRNLREHYVLNPGKSYETRQRVTAPILGALAAEGRIHRTRPAGSWTSAQFRWAPSESFPAVPAPEAKAALARHSLVAFGPVTAAMSWTSVGSVVAGQCAERARQLVRGERRYGEGGGGRGA
ncbi:winged helix DNA-binding domain-containing protein [Streptomyces rectiverticillatus]|uniref:DNA glycosylase AlkZ-like family protein n=1 Tax=Streptomyces rectiverticillatus TaxID=173860 RepID=UPI0015C40466|nr:crosslink repair DNA glycosylase YcaQ family protein [Streptomyces rectiverticillatus]QLE70488.1 winged helix DNA-binding domain-containing protein [Streptomyces rectiverticillatus]